MVGQNIGKYRILERIGRGGMGTVYRATDETLSREVAIKVLNAELNDPGVARRFRAEAVTVARLSHPGLATIYELFQHDGQWLMVMEFVRGETLEALVSRAGALAVDVAGPLCMQALNALAHAHSMGIVHRDLKPANIMVNASGTVKVMDFGIARVAGTEHLTSAGFLMGTPAYMAPEQVTVGEVDARADLYAIGVVFFHLLTAKLPFAGTTPFEMAQSRISGAPIPVRSVRDGLPPWVEQVMTIALAREPSARYQSAALFHEALRRGLANLPLDTPHETVVRPELVATALPGTLPVFNSPFGAGTTAAPTGAVSPSSVIRLDVTSGAAGGVAPGTTGLGPVAPTPLYTRGADLAAPPVLPPAGPPTADAPPIAASPANASIGLAPPVPPVRRSPTTMVAALAAGVVVLAASAYWVWPRPTPESAPVEPTGAAQPPTGPDAASTPVPPATPPTGPAGPALGPPLAPAQPAGTVPPASGPSSTSTLPPGATPPATVPGVPVPPGGTTPAIPGTTPSRTTPPGARRGRGPATDPRLAFDDVRVIVVGGRRAAERGASLVFEAGSLSLEERPGGGVLGRLRYQDLARATYVRGRNPRWDTALPAPGADVNFPGGLFSGARHWLTLQSSSIFVILRLENATWRQVVEAVTARTGVAVREASGGT